jgi:uncharacterized membrane protein YgaE (UPF0421/DUF939 family)
MSKISELFGRKWSVMIALIIAAVLVVIFQPATTIEIAWIVLWAAMVFMPCQVIEGVFERYFKYKEKELAYKNKAGAA